MSPRKQSKIPSPQKTNNTPLKLSLNPLSADFPIVAIASSAGGISALKIFFKHMPPATGIAFVVIQHLESNFDSKLVELLQPDTSMHIFQASDQMKIAPDCIYVIPSNNDLTIRNGVLYLVNRPVSHQQHLPADHFFQALAQDQKNLAIGIVLSGMGFDGTTGIREIKKNHGLTFAQDPNTAEFDSMPRSAIATGCIDDFGLVAELPSLIIAQLKHDQLHKTNHVDFEKTHHTAALTEIIQSIYQQTGHDFSQYKKNTLQRRIERRLTECQVENIVAYQKYLQQKPEEIDLLFKELLINVTYFFRDSEVWRYLVDIALPSLLAKQVKGGILRAWIPACSTGEEAYSLAMLFSEVIEQTAITYPISLQIFATDLDADALNKARIGFFPLSISENISPERLNRFFIKKTTGYQIADAIRDKVIFAEHNITKDAPFSKLDLLFCRNLLIYFDRHLQENLLPMFHYALNPEGFLLLGTSETIGRFDDLFQPVNIKLPIYKRANSDRQTVYPNFQHIQYDFLATIRNKKNLLNNPIKLITSSQKAKPESETYVPLSFMMNKKGEITCLINDTDTIPDTNQNDHCLPLTEKMSFESLMMELQISREELHAAHEEMQTSQEELRSGNEELRATNENLNHANKKLQQANDELIDFKKKLLETNERLNTTNTELVTYIQAIGELALVSVTDRFGTIIETNARFCEINEYSKEELVGTNYRILNSGQHTKEFFAEMWQTITKGQIWHKEICNRTKSGKLYWADSVIVPLKDTQNNIEQYISIKVDISKRKQKEMQLVEQLREKSCLYAIHRDMVKASSLQRLCNQIIKYLTQAMHFPEITACKISLFHESFTSSNYHPDLTKGLSAKIKVNGKTCGQLQVFYTEDKPFSLPDEQNLIHFIAEDLGMWYERKNHEQHINHLACHDALTGLPNRLLLQDRITQVLEFNQRHHGTAAVLFIDLDNFKNINDTFGHNVGDLLLKKVANRLSTSIRSEDTVARHGGDEFIVVLPYLVETGVVERVAQKILHQLAEPYYINQHEFFITCSIGIALYPEHGRDADILLKHSDTAMYHAKSSGRNSLRYFSHEMNLKAIEKHKITNYLHSAVKENALELYFQPIVDINHHIASLEVLLRWQHKKEGWIPPVKFIPLAEESGLILQLGDWIIKSACLQIKSWINTGYSVPKLSINLSAKQFQHKLFVANIQQILFETGVTAHHLILEITESVLMKDDDLVKMTLNQLSELGFIIAIDDFGTGYSSLAYLKHYPIDKLKIDRSFINDITTDENDAAIVTATINMAHSLGMQVVAEGVETEKQLSFLNEKGCDLYQGFYFGKPIPTIQTTESLKQIA